MLSGALEQSIDREHLALFVIGTSGGVLFASSAAEGLARNSSWLRMNGNGIHLTNHELDQKLQHRLHNCREIVERRAADQSGELEVVTQNSGRFRLSLAPLMFQGPLLGVDRPAVVVTITRLAEADSESRDRLRSLTSS